MQIYEVLNDQDRVFFSSICKNGGTRARLVSEWQLFRPCNPVVLVLSTCYQKQQKLSTMTRLQLTDPVYKSFNDLVNNIFNDTPAKRPNFFPPTNIFESQDDFQIELLVPGRLKEDFKISVDKKLLTIGYEAPQAKEDENRTVVRSEFSMQSFRRAFQLDEKINADAIEAKYENGILTVILPKKEEVKILPKDIAVQ